MYSNGFLCFAQLSPEEVSKGLLLYWCVLLLHLKQETALEKTVTLPVPLKVLPAYCGCRTSSELSQWLQTRANLGDTSHMGMCKIFLSNKAIIFIPYYFTSLYEE